MLAVRGLRRSDRRGSPESVQRTWQVHRTGVPLANAELDNAHELWYSPQSRSSVLGRRSGLGLDISWGFGPTALRSKTDVRDWSTETGAPASASGTESRAVPRVRSSIPLAWTGQLEREDKGLGMRHGRSDPSQIRRAAEYETAVHWSEQVLRRPKRPA